MKTENYSITYFIDLFKAHGDGIYVLYNDCLSRDAANTIVIKDGEISENERNYCFSTYNYYGDGNPCGIGPRTKELMAKYPELKAYTVNFGYFSFRNQWQETDMDRQLREFCGIDAEAIAF